MSSTSMILDLTGPRWKSKNNKTCKLKRSRSGKKPLLFQYQNWMTSKSLKSPSSIWIVLRLTGRKLKPDAQLLQQSDILSKSNTKTKVVVFLQDHLQSYLHLRTRFQLHLKVQKCLKERIARKSIYTVTIFLGMRQTRFQKAQSLSKKQNHNRIFVKFRSEIRKKYSSKKYNNWHKSREPSLIGKIKLTCFSYMHRPTSTSSCFKNLIRSLVTLVRS